MLLDRRKRPHSALNIVDSVAAANRRKRSRQGPLIEEYPNVEKRETAQPSSKFSVQAKSMLPLAQSTPSATSTASSSSSTSSSSAGNETDEDDIPDDKLGEEDCVGNNDSISSSSTLDDSTSTSASDTESSDYALNIPNTTNAETLGPLRIDVNQPIVSLSPYLTSLHARLCSFLPALAAANRVLEQEHAEGRLAERNMEIGDRNENGEEEEHEDEGQYIEMNLGLGVLKEIREGDTDSESDSSASGSEWEGLETDSNSKRDVLGDLLGASDTRKRKKPVIEDVSGEAENYSCPLNQ